MTNTQLIFDTQVLNAQIKDLKSKFSKKESFEQATEQFCALHAMFYRSELSKSKQMTYEDLLWEDITESVLRTATNEKGRTILYGLWHSTRIEDITMNMLVCREEQLYRTGKFKSKINTGIDHTGNSLSPPEILQMSARINIDALCDYRLEVAQKSQTIIKSLDFTDMKRKVLKTDIDRILNEGAVDNKPSANWLLDFWGSKNVQGILFMPACRHQIVHLNENFRAKRRGLTK